MSAASRYVVYGELASGGMATVHLGRLVGPNGFSRTVAVKRLHPMFAKDATFAEGFMDEARIASRIRHPNVVPTVDVIAEGGELLLVMEYIPGESLGALLRASHRCNELVPPTIAANVMVGVLHGLHAAHEATDESGRPLHIVHRDMSPQNVLVGSDGVARVLDFGIAKAINRSQNTRDGELRGKLSYMAPEQFSGSATRRSDVYSASVVLWEALTRRRLFSASDSAGMVGQVLAGAVTSPRELVPDVPPELDAVVMRGLARDPNERFATALEMAIALEQVAPVLPPRTIGAWVERLAESTLAARAAAVNAIEAGTPDTTPVPAAGDDLRTVTMVVPIAGEGDPTTDVGPLAEAYAANAARPPPSRRRMLIGAAVIGAAISVALGFGVAALRVGLQPPLSVAPVEVSTVTAEMPAPTPAPAPQPSNATVDSPNAPESDASASPISSEAARRPAARGPRKAVQPSCSPPYREVVVDGHVRRIPKPACL